MTYWGDIWNSIGDIKVKKGPYMWSFYKILLNGINLKGKKVLEIGCGTGTNSVLMAKAGADVTCVDMSRESLKLVKRSMDRAGVRCKRLCIDAFDLGFENEFDIVTSEGVVEHFLGVPRQKILDIHARAAKRGGRVVIIVPNLHSPGYRFGKWLAEKTGTWIYGNEYPYSMEELEKRLEASGLKVVKKSGGELLFGFGWLFAPLWLTNHKFIGKSLSADAKEPVVKLNYNNSLADRWGRVIGIVAKKR